MTLSLTIILIAISLIPLKLAIFECTFALILTTPVLAYLLGRYYELSNTSYLISFAFLYFILFVSSYKSKASRQIDLKAELLPIIIFTLSFFFIHSLTLKWPDFISIGERLRDFAILSSVIQSPIELKEPWMAGYPLNYYAFWYRFGHMLSSLFNLKTWDVYHILQSFSYALYFASAFRLFSKYLKINLFLSVFFSILICFGSNYAGIKDYVLNEPGWWGPSRVIPGAINEFPAWSLLLGDLHPHYLNLPLLPFFLIFFTYILISTANPANHILVAISAFSVCSMWLSNSNVWDKPVWWMLFITFAVYFLIEIIKEAYFSLEVKEYKYKDLFSFAFFIQILLVISLVLSLYFSQKNIVTPDYSICPVNGRLPFFNSEKCPSNIEISGTLLHDFSLHFGIPLFIILAAFIIEVPVKILRLTSVLLAFYFFFFSEALPLLIILLIIDLFKINAKYKIFSRAKSEISVSQIIIEGIGIFSLMLLMVPEIIFLNDPYGSDVERMNTIFKIYSVGWFFIHVFAFAQLSAPFDKVLTYCRERNTTQGRLITGSLASLLILFPVFIYGTGFFFVTADEREMKNQTIEPKSEGLSEPDRLFPGSAVIIRTLRTLPKGILLEAQGKPYDYTTMIATLSENPAYLGWANHVNLLLNNTPEVARREKVTEGFYTEADCNKKSDILKTENIKYFVYGPLEKAKYPSSAGTNFECLNLIKSEKDFKLYSY